MILQSDWGSLLPELLELVLEHLPDLLFYHEIRSVCQHWNHIARHKGIGRIHVTRNLLEDEEVLEAIISASSASLRVLVLDKLNLGNRRDGAVTFISHLFAQTTVVESLSLDSNGIWPSTMSLLSPSIGTFKNLQSLSLNDNKIGSEGMKQLSEHIGMLSTLRQLRLCRNHISSFVLTGDACSSLHTLVLSGNPLGDEGAASVASFMSQAPALMSLSLDCCGVRAAGVSALCSALTHTRNTQLCLLDLCNNRLGPEGAAFLADTLIHNNTLRVLDLKYCDVRESGGMCLGAALALNASLVSLNLRYNNIKSGGCARVAHALRDNTTLRVLDLSHNSLDGICAVGLAHSLASNRSLHTLMLEANSVGTMGARALAAMLASNNSSLHTINLDSNGIGSEGAASFVPVIRNTSALTLLNLSHNHVSEACMRELREAVASVCARRPRLAVMLENNRVECLHHGLCPPPGTPTPHSPAPAALPHVQHGTEIDGETGEVVRDVASFSGTSHRHVADSGHSGRDGMDGREGSIGNDGRADARVARGPHSLHTALTAPLYNCGAASPHHPHHLHPHDAPLDPQEFLSSLFTFTRMASVASPQAKI
eukprot:TRINITY_DN14902_c0_g1::TRINITY_DN14902_c0_g1_i1::g.16316::m.16316 TRINITY_DN14902_c0_g1::TRINITY_DN14902_c0_g1_i1::g.16316  ORF type:complete len:597 (+),score=36.60,sp/Q7RTR2/NLRC3_HUMAN/30.33/9e-33,sp/Q7RTR2/NLRC3_HUMAN/30.43/3e-27,sp/Q7RTR2/NLRC3_HUMAN/29.10/6e-22,sp/Q7RTR2/NLRC3_HUMAN/25.17/4e-07,LRR_6/PF13516.1/1.4e+04,LRR_6/PF13516.1/1.7e+03,LRR_6/PF13516.1/0.00047,LRR_6/PF13516.1/98,LRR_6/PF13516.1/0.0008,LRR_6/PF13516.1/5.9,LRR_6/PF13516.1/0.8,LRR_6/PF13516.1/28,LRR_6/PF13516.1/1.9,LRR_6